MITEIEIIGPSAYQTGEDGQVRIKKFELYDFGAGAQVGLSGLKEDGSRVRGFILYGEDMDNLCETWLKHRGWDVGRR